MTIARLAVLLMGGALGACIGSGDGGGGGGFCDDFTFAACGGDVVGVWSLEEVCPSASAVDIDYVSEEYPGCSSTNRSRDTTRVTAVDLAIDAAGTYTRSVTKTVRTELTLDRSCAALVAVDFMPGASLEEICQFLDDNKGQQAIGSCSVSGDECTCDYTVSEVEDEAGAWTATGSDLSLSSAWRTMPFCVEGNQLALEHDDTLPGQDATHVVLTR